MSDKVNVPHAGLKPQPVHGGPNVELLSEGTLLEPVGAVPGWLLRKTPSGNIGWVPEAAVSPVVVPIVVGPSGIAMPTSIAGWKQVFADDFTTDVALGSFPDQVRWGADVGWNDTSGHGKYDPAGTLSVSNHRLTMHIHATTDSAGVVTYHVCAPYPIINPIAKQPIGRNFGAGLTYARIDVCARIADLPGYKTAWLFWPTDNIRVPNQSIPSALHGEIDWPEGPCDGGPRQISAFMHHMDSTSNNDQEWRHVTVDRTQWHVYSTVWMKDSLTFLLDGVPLGLPMTTRVPSAPMHYKMQTECAIVAAKPDPKVAGDVEFDWIVVSAPAA